MNQEVAAVLVGLVVLGAMPLFFAWKVSRSDPIDRVVERLRAYSPASAVQRPDWAVRENRRIYSVPIFGAIHSGIEQLLERAALSYTPGSIIGLTLAVGVVIGGAAHLLAGSPILTVAGTCAGWTLPWLYVRTRIQARQRKLESQLADALMPFYVRTRIQARQRKLESQLADALMLIAGAVRAGHTFMQGVQVVAKEARAPVAAEFQRVIQVVGLGHSGEAALEDLAERNGNYDLRLTVTAINIQRRVGGNLAEVLERIAETVRERERIRGEVRALTAQGRLSGLVISLIPVALLGILLLTSPSYAGVLTYTAPGRLLLGISAVAWLIGFLLIKRIMKIEY